jgi:ankyrin repeat protein
MGRRVVLPSKIHALGLIRLCLVLVILFPAVAAADSLESWVRSIRARDVTALSTLLNRGFTQVNVSTQDGKTALMVSAQGLAAKLSLDLIKAGADANARNSNGGTPLMHAAVSGDVKIVSALIEVGARVNTQAGNGWTALALAAAKGHLLVIQKLLSSGADPNLSDVFGWTPLMQATEQKRLAAVQALVALPGINLNAANAEGATALHRAVAQGFVDIARALVQGGASLEVPDQKGRTPYDYARETGRSEMLGALTG